MKLKFRVWDKRNRKMIYLNDIHDSFTFDRYGRASYYNLQNGDGSEDGYSDPMPFTGLIDKNGVEIYYNDIVKYKNHKFVVLYDSGGFILVRLNNNTDMYELFSDYLVDNVYPLLQLMSESASEEENIIFELSVIGNQYD